MTSTKTPKPRADDQRTETLLQFSTMIDAHLGYEAGFADHVRGLRMVRGELTALRAARAAANALIKEFDEAGQRSVAGWELRRSEPTPIVQVRAVPSDVAKRYNPRLWTAAKAPTSFVQAKAHPATPPVKTKLVLPPTPTRGGLAAAIEHLKGLPKLSPLTEVEREHVEALDKIGANAGWDGLPIEFADRWLVGLRRLQYDSDRLREVDPEAWERLAITKPVGGVSRLYVASVSGEAVDLDGE